MSSALERNLREVRDRIERACASVGRDPATVTLIAVTKTVPVDRIREAVDLGLRDFGESRWQEAREKLPQLPADLTWHFIGRLQSNKAKKVAESFQVIHTLDSPSQLPEIAKAGRPVDALIELNLAGEAQKGGIPIETLDEFRALVLNYHQVRLRGLMTVGPLCEDPEAMRPTFRTLRDLGSRCRAEWLSMGMSGDFEVGIQEGATHIRVGSALFGARN